MPLHLLCISRCAGRGHAAGPADPPELQRHDLQWIEEGELCAALVQPLPRVTGAMDHAALLAAIFQRVDILPVRYAVTMADERAVRDLLRRRGAELLEILDRLQGTAEMGLRVQIAGGRPRQDLSPPHHSTPSDNAAIRYLAGRRIRYQQQDELGSAAERTIASCLRAAGGLYRDWKRLPSQPTAALRLAFLVERGLLAAFTGRLQAWAARRRHEPCSLVGPWPPYSFVVARCTPSSRARSTVGQVQYESWEDHGSRDPIDA